MSYHSLNVRSLCLKPIFHLATLFARREAKTRIRQRDWLKLAGEKNSPRTSRNRSYLFVCSREQIRQVENRLKLLKNRLDILIVQFYVWPIYVWPIFTNCIILHTSTHPVNFLSWKEIRLIVRVKTTDLNYWIKHPFEFSDPILKPEYL